MPAYVSTPLGPPPETLQPGVPGYAFGSFNANLPTTKMLVTTTASTGGTATVGVQVIEGKIPDVGSLVTIRGTSQGAGAFNVTNIAITAVSIVAGTGVGTIQFALVGTVVSAADAGLALVPTPEVGEALTNATSKTFAVPEPVGSDTNQKGVVWSTSYPSAPGAVTMVLQGSLFDIDGQYQTVDTSTNVNGETRVYGPSNFRFFRLKASGVSGGTNPTVIGKIFI